MIAISRRSLLASTAMVAAGTVAAIALSSCSATSVNAALAQAGQDAQIIASGLAGSLSQLSSLNISGLTPGIMGSVNTALADMQKVAATVQAATTVAAAQPSVQQIETDLNAIVGAVAGLPLPAEISVPLQAAAILLPVIETAVGLAINQIGSPKPATSAALTPDQARLILQGAALH